MNYIIGDFVVCPGHGVGQIQSIEERATGDTVSSFYIIKILSNNMTVMVPTAKEDAIRDLAAEDEIGQVFELLKDHDVILDTSTWNRRYRDYMNKIKTGSLLEIADVLRSLFLLKHSKTLSFGEKKMLDYCKELIIKEIALSVGNTEIDVNTKIDSCFH